MNRWPRYILPLSLLLTAALVFTGALYAISKVNRIVRLDRVNERRTYILAEHDHILSNTESAERQLVKHFTSADPVARAAYKAQMHDIWSHVGNLWHLAKEEEEVKGVLEMQSAIHHLEEIMNRQANHFAQSGHAEASWESERREAREEFLLTANTLRKGLIPVHAQSKADQVINWRNLQLAVFLTPLISVLMLLLSFRHIYLSSRKESEHAQAVSRAKSQFLANMSHEIRTPLAAVLGFADVLGQKNVSEVLRGECVSALKRNGQLLLKIIDDILDLSKIEAQKLVIQAVAFDLRETIRDVEIVMAAKAREHGIDLHLELTASAKGIFCSDPMKIKQILLNIIGNAIKFTRQGQVQVAVAVDAGTRLRVEVRDTGIGISAKESERLFRPFTQADATTERQFGGTGLGLSISRQLAQAMGGDVKLLSSKPGKGSVFEVTLPLQLASGLPPYEAKGAPRSVEGRWQGKTVLVVDDSEDNRQLMELYLQPTGISVLQAKSAAEALRIVSSTLPDLILMDIQMPEKNGYDATREIRGMGLLQPIIAFTAHAMVDELDQCRASGCDTVLTKPVFRDDLYGILERYL